MSDDIRVVGVLSWYAESAHWLATTVAGFSQVCDAIVAVDGAYRLFPKAWPRSQPEQAETIIQACEAHNVACLIHQPNTLYDSEVAKRNHSLQLARSLNPDWVLIFDADEHIMRVDPERVRHTLATTDKHVVTHTLRDGKDLMADPGLEKHAIRTDADVEWTLRTRQCYRWTDDLQYEHAHYFVGGTYDGDWHWLRGPDLCAGEQHRASPAEHLNEALVVNHRTASRAKVRRDAMKEYYLRRDAVGQEALPEVIHA